MSSSEKFDIVCGEFAQTHDDCEDDNANIDNVRMAEHCCNDNELVAKPLSSSWTGHNFVWYNCYLNDILKRCNTHVHTGKCSNGKKRNLSGLE